MDLTLSETATILGKSPRQIRYLIKAGRLRATKHGRHWKIDSDHLPLSDAQRRVLGERLEVARRAFEKSVDPAARAVGREPAKAAEGNAAKKKSYSVNDLLAFQAGEAIYHELAGELGEDAAATRNLFDALAVMTRACHAFHANDKASRFIEARELAATAVADLLLRAAADRERQRTLARRIEEEVIPKIGGLIASHEKRSQRGRFDRFGSATAPRGKS